MTFRAQSRRNSSALLPIISVACNFYACNYQCYWYLLYFCMKEMICLKKCNYLYKSQYQVLMPMQQLEIASNWNIGRLANFMVPPTTYCHPFIIHSHYYIKAHKSVRTSDTYNCSNCADTVTEMHNMRYNKIV